MNGYSKFLKINRSQNYERWEPNNYSKMINKKEFLYIDFEDENANISIMQQSNPDEGDSEQQTQVLGGAHISGLNKLTSNTYNIMKYLSDNRTNSEKIQNIDNIVRHRVQKMKKKKSIQNTSHNQNIINNRNACVRRLSDHKINRNSSQISHYHKNKISANQSSLELSSFRNKPPIINASDRYYLETKEQKFVDPQKIEDYLERLALQKMKQKFRAQQRYLQKSLSSAGQFKKLRNRSVDYKINDRQVKLPKISKKEDNKKK